MEPRARVGKNRGQQTFSEQELQLLLYSHGDVPHPLSATKKVLDDALTDFITNLAFETAAAAQLAGRQKIKVDDVKHACRRNPVYLGKIEEAFEKKNAIEKAKTLVNVDNKNLKDLVGEQGRGANATGTENGHVGSGGNGVGKTARGAGSRGGKRGGKAKSKGRKKERSMNEDTFEDDGDDDLDMDGNRSGDANASVLEDINMRDVFHG